MKREFKTAAAFRTSLEQQLLNRAKKLGVDYQRLRKTLAFDRALARLFATSEAPWYLKGGYSLELRSDFARTTRDIDLSLKPGMTIKSFETQVLKVELQKSLNTDLSDYFEFIVGEGEQDINNAPYGGARLKVEARLDGRTFEKFPIDIGVGDYTLDPLDEIELEDALDFAGIAPGRIKIIRVEQQFAEKLHAYTRDRGVPNSRVKDLVDMIILLGRDDLNAELLKDTITKTFERRKSHSLPAQLDPPPANWEKPFLALSTEAELDISMEEAFRRVQSIFNKLFKPTSK